MGILTEEELKQFEYENEKSFVRMLDVRKLINSHRNSLTAKAELKAENFDLKASVILNVRENKRLREELK